MASTEEYLGVLSITQGTYTDTPNMIQRLEPSESNCNLGVHLDPMGSHETQPMDLLKQGRQFSAAAVHKSIDQVNDNIMYKILCTPEIHYPLPVSNIPSKALKSMQTNLLKKLKRKMKFRRWCGLSLRESCFKQGLGHFKILLAISVKTRQQHQRSTHVSACYS
jgi:hypothetical protein